MTKKRFPRSYHWHTRVHELIHMLHTHGIWLPHMVQAQARMHTNAHTCTTHCMCTQLEEKEAALLEKAEKLAKRLADKNPDKDAPASEDEDINYKKMKCKLLVSKPA